MRWGRIAACSGLLAAVAATGLGLSLWLSAPRLAPTPPQFAARAATDAEQRMLVDALRLDLAVNSGRKDGRLPDINAERHRSVPAADDPRQARIAVR